VEVSGATADCCTAGVSITFPPGPTLKTIGWSGAIGFLRCEVTKSAEARVAATVSAVAPALSANARTRSDRRHRSSQERHVLERGAEDLSGIRTEVAAEDLLIHGAKVD
jgi:hypothetical protein